MHSALIFERAYEYSSLLISPQSHLGIVSKYSSIFPTSRVVFVSLLYISTGSPSILSVPFWSLWFIQYVHSLLPEGIPNPYRRDKHSFSSQNLHICKNYCNFAPVISPRLGIMSLRVGDYKT